MASSSWKDDEELKADLEKYVRRNLKRSEILDFVKLDFPEYAWSIATLDRRLDRAWKAFGLQSIKPKA